MAETGGGYEREQVVQDVRVLRGRIELNCGTQHLVATILSGEAELALVEKFDEAITAFGTEQPVRIIGQRQKLRLTIEADLDGMTIDVYPPPGETP